MQKLMLQQPELTQTHDSRFHAWFFREASAKQQKANDFFRAMEQLLADAKEFKHIQLVSSLSVTVWFLHIAHHYRHPQSLSRGPVILISISEPMTFEPLTYENCGPGKKYRKGFMAQYANMTVR